MGKEGRWIVSLVDVACVLDSHRLISSCELCEKRDPFPKAERRTALASRSAVLLEKDALIKAAPRRAFEFNM